MKAPRSRCLGSRIAPLALAVALGGCHCEPAGTSARARPSPAPGPDDSAASRALAAEIDAVVLPALAAMHAPGATVTVVREGRVAHQKAYGAGHLSPRVPMTIDGRFAIASVTKVFTALAVLRLVDDRKLRLDGAVGALLPDLPAAWRPITVRQLLAMQSGIPSTGLRRPWDEILAWAADRPLDFAPGTAVRYSNSNFLLLGRVIEAAAGERYQPYLDRAVLGPLGMTATGANALPPPPGVVSGYAFVEGGFREASYKPPPSSWSSGWLVSNQPDLVKLDAALRGGRLLGRQSLAAMFTPQSLADGRPTQRGLAWDALFSAGGRRFAEKTGGVPGFRSDFVHGIDDGTAVVVLVNGAVKGCPRLARALLDVVVGDRPAAHEETDVEGDADE